MKIINLKNLQVYHKVKQLSINIYKETRGFPEREKGYNGIVNQIRRASLSAASNIAEGTTRKDREMLYFLSISLGSLREIECQLEISKGVGYITEERYLELADLVDECSAKLVNYMKKISQRSTKNEISNN